MRQYQDIVRRVLEEGAWKDNRTGVRTKIVPGVFFEHDMQQGFPLLTCRKLPFKAITVEAEGFIQGITSKKWYQDRGCHFWDNWANPKRVAAASNATHFFNKYEDIAKLEDDLGPMGYSYQQRNFNYIYDEEDGGTLEKCDQLKKIVETLKTNPNDRRMVSCLWNPLQLDRMALPPCTVAWVITVVGDTLNLSWFQRSADLILGIPSDIANNALILSLLCVETGLFAGKLTGLFVDAHIYENHIPAANELLTRGPRPLPTVGIVTVKDDDPNYKFDFFKWTHKDTVLYNYNPHPKLDMGTIAV